MTDNERAVIEAAVEWQRFRDAFGKTSHMASEKANELSDAINELHNEHDGKWRPSDGQGS